MSKDCRQIWCIIVMDSWHHRPSDPWWVCANVDPQKATCKCLADSCCHHPHKGHLRKHAKEAFLAIVQFTSRYTRKVCLPVHKSDQSPISSASSPCLQPHLQPHILELLHPSATCDKGTASSGDRLYWVEMFQEANSS